MLASPDIGTGSTSTSLDNIKQALARLRPPIVEEPPPARSPEIQALLDRVHRLRPPVKDEPETTWVMTEGARLKARWDEVLASRQAAFEANRSASLMQFQIESARRKEEAEHQRLTEGLNLLLDDILNKEAINARKRASKKRCASYGFGWRAQRRRNFSRSAHLQTPAIKEKARILRNHY